MASVSGIFFFRPALLHRAQLIPEIVEFDADRVLTGQLLVGVALVLDELGTHLGSTQTGVEPRGGKRGVGLALGLNQGLDILQKIRQVVLSRFATTGGEVILYRLA